MPHRATSTERPRAPESAFAPRPRGRPADRSPTTRAGHLLRGPCARRRDRDDHV